MRCRTLPVVLDHALGKYLVPRHDDFNQANQFSFTEFAAHCPYCFYWVVLRLGCVENFKLDNTFEFALDLVES